MAKDTKRMLHMDGRLFACGISIRLTQKSSAVLENSTTTTSMRSKRQTESDNGFICCCCEYEGQQRCC